MDFHYHYMREALREAQKAYELNEVPIGAIVVHEDTIIGRGHNLRITNKSPLDHAELIAIAQGAKVIGDWRFENCTLYVTVEPCPMCAGAILQARIPTLIYGIRNPKAGCCGSIYNLLEDERFNHQVEVVEGVMAEESRRLMQSFFKKLRAKAGTENNGLA